MQVAKRGQVDGVRGGGPGEGAREGEQRQRGEEEQRRHHLVVSEVVGTWKKPRRGGRRGRGRESVVSNI